MKGTVEQIMVELEKIGAKDFPPLSYEEMGEKMKYVKNSHWSGSFRFLTKETWKSKGLNIREQVEEAAKMPNGLATVYYLNQGGVSESTVVQVKSEEVSE